MKKMYLLEKKWYCQVTTEYILCFQIQIFSANDLPFYCLEVAYYCIHRKGHIFSLAEQCLLNIIKVAFAHFLKRFRAFVSWRCNLFFLFEIIIALLDILFLLWWSGVGNFCLQKDFRLLKKVGSRQF